MQSLSRLASADEESSEGTVGMRAWSGLREGCGIESILVADEFRLRIAADDEGLPNVFGWDQQEIGSIKFRTFFLEPPAPISVRVCARKLARAARA